MQMLLLCHLFILQFSLHASEDWISRIHSEDQSNYYYVGVSEGRSKLNEAYQEAYINAINEAVLHNYGVGLEYTTSIMTELEGVTLHESSILKSKNINLEGISPVKEKVIKENELYTVYRQIKYPKYEILKEKNRRRTKTGILNIYGDNGHRSTLELSTLPNDANVEIISLDRKYKRFATTDCRISIPHGKYKVIINRAGYRTLSVDVNHMGLTKKHFVLKKTQASVRLRVEPHDAKIYVNDKEMNSYHFKLYAKENNIIKLKHPDYYELTYPIVVEDQDHLDLGLSMRAKSSHIKIITKPSGAKVFIGNQYKGISPLSTKIDQDESVRVVKSGYEEYTGKLYFKPNRYLPEERIKLSKITEDSRRKWILSYNPVVNREGETKFALLPFKVEYKLYSHLWIYADIQAIEDDLDDDYMLTSTRLEIGAELVLYKSQDGFINIGYGYLEEKLTLSYGPGEYKTEVDSETYTAQTYSVNLGLKMFKTKSGNLYLNIGAKQSVFDSVRENDYVVGIGFEF